MEDNKLRVRERLAEIYSRPGILKRFWIRDINEEETDFSKWSERLFSPEEIDQIIIQSNLIMLRVGDPEQGLVEYRSLSACNPIHPSYPTISNLNEEHSTNTNSPRSDRSGEKEI